eukprot:scaffold1240_cov101-Isochrysis_galbana.AAC.11
MHVSHGDGAVSNLGHHRHGLVAAFLEASKIVLGAAGEVPKVLRLQPAVARGLVGVAFYVAVVIPSLERRGDGVALRCEAALLEPELGDPPSVLVVQVKFDGVHRLKGMNGLMKLLRHADAGRIAEYLRNVGKVREPVRDR